MPFSVRRIISTLAIPAVAVASIVLLGPANPVSAQDLATPGITATDTTANKPATDGVSTAAIVCGEASCTAVQGAYISQYTNTGCTGTESYYTPYFNYDGIRRSWNGGGLAGTILRTETNRSWKDSAGVCHNDWPNGNTLSNFVRIYR